MWCLHCGNSTGLVVLSGSSAITLATPFTQLRSQISNLVCCRYIFFKRFAVVLSPGRCEGDLQGGRCGRVRHHTDRRLVSDPTVSGGRSGSSLVPCNMSVSVRPTISSQISARLQESAGELIRRNMSSLLSLTPASRTSLNCLYLQTEQTAPPSNSARRLLRSELVRRRISAIFPFSSA